MLESKTGVSLTGSSPGKGVSREEEYPCPLGPRLALTDM